MRKIWAFLWYQNLQKLKKKKKKKMKKSDWAPLNVAPGARAPSASLQPWSKP